MEVSILGKKEMERMPIKYLIMAVFLIIVVIGLYLIIFSVPPSHLEAKITQRADFKVEQTSQFAFSNGGQVIVAQDIAQNGMVQVYAKIPVVNRYMRTEELEFKNDGEPINFAADEWSNSAAFKLDKGIVTRPGVGDDMGYSGDVLYFLIWVEGFIIAMTLIRNDVIKTRKEKAANPVKNY